MCIAIYKPAGQWASKQELRTCYQNNPHGAGYAWHDGEQIHLIKGFFSWRSFWKSFKQHVTAETPAFIHFRIKTSGKQDAEHCHPFAMKYGVLMHNGPCINYKHCSGDGERSDTRQFVEDFVGELDSRQFRRLQPMIEDFAGTEKIVAMFNDGEVVICNEDHGHWDHGIWWSNHSYRDYSTWTAPTKSWRDFVDEYNDDAWDYAPGKPRVVYKASDFNRTWSRALGMSVRASVKIKDDTYKWDEAMCGYILKNYVASQELFPVPEEGVVYAPDPTSGSGLEVGFLIDTVHDYHDLLSIADAEESVSAATA